MYRVTTVLSNRFLSAGVSSVAMSLPLSTLSGRCVRREAPGILPVPQLSWICGLDSRIGSFSAPFRRFRTYNIENSKNLQMAYLQRRFLSRMVSTSVAATTKAGDFFNRPSEILSINELLDGPPQISLISGPKNSGKTALITKVLEERFTTNSIPILYINLRDVSFKSSEEFISALERFMDSWLSSLASKLKSLISAAAIENSYIIPFKLTINRTDKAPARLEQILTQMNNHLPVFSMLQGQLSPILFIDEANRMNELFADDDGKSCLRNLFNWFVSNTKESHRFHVILASSDNFFHRWLQDNYLLGGVFNTYTIGDLPKAEAKKYWDDKLKPDEAVSSFEEAYTVCGGNMFYLRNYALQSKQRHPSKELGNLSPTQTKKMTPGAFSYVRQESARLDYLFQRSQEANYLWTKEQFITLINKLISQADSKAECFLIYRVLCAEMKDTRVVDAFIEHNILHIRTSKDFAYDLMDAPEDEAIVTPENPALLFAMRKFIKQQTSINNCDSHKPQ